MLCHLITAAGGAALTCLPPSLPPTFSVVSQTFPNDRVRSTLTELSEEELDKAMAIMDIDGGGDVDFDEFSAWWIQVSTRNRGSSSGKARQPTDLRGDH